MAETLPPFKVVITDSDLGSGEIERKELEGLAELTKGSCRTEEEIIEIARDADGLLVQYAPITRRIIESLERCRVISRYGIGIDMIDVEAATERGIYVIRIPDYCIEEVSDHTCALILACTRKILQLHSRVKAAIWDVKAASPIYRLKGKTVGLVGFGNIARRVSQKLRGFDFKIVAFDPYIDPSFLKEYGVRPVSFETLLGESDVISLHLPLTEETFHLFGLAELSAMKSTAFLINTSRGKLIDENALYTAVREKRIAGAGLDVLEDEPVSPDNKLLSLDNTIITPHAAFYSARSSVELQMRTARDAARVLRGEIPDTVVNRNLSKSKS
jgi:D-3-phosphoglycerate dehydrogenase